ncbi:MAG: PIG-L family deacetylase [Caldilineales bacterium]
MTLLAIFAHPDDESFGPGGTLARYAAQGVAVWLACATDGAAGTVDAELLADGKTTPQLRAEELCCAAQALGLAGVEWLGYRDSGMAGSADNDHPNSLFQAPLEEVAARLAALMRKHRPRVVICDNQFGGYGHPDHIKLHQATVRAVSVAADAAALPEAGPAWQVQRLYFTAFTPGLLKLLVRLMPLFRKDPRRFGRNHDIDLVQIVSWETPIHARINVRDFLAVKQQASACHHSQGGGGQGFRFVPQFIQRRMMEHESFTRGLPVPQPSDKVEHDLFG